MKSRAFAGSTVGSRVTADLPLLLLIDNYDSFTHNLSQCFSMLGQNVRVLRNDRLTAEEAEAMHPQRVVISSGPGHPSGAGICTGVIRRLARRIPVLGICLGHQCLAHAFGGEVVRAGRIMHGKTSPVRHDGTGLHSGVPQDFAATRYHSLVVREETLPRGFRVTARADDGVVMAIADETRGLYGLQYHPESILTEPGMAVLRNFLDITTDRGHRREPDPCHPWPVEPGPVEPRPVEPPRAEARTKEEQCSNH